MMDTRKRVAAFVAAAGLVTALSGCRIDITPEPGDPTLPPVGSPPPVAVTFDGDASLDKPFAVVKADDADLASEVEEGVYVTAGALEGAAANSCQFVQTREVKVEAVERVEVAVSDAALDVDQADVKEPAAVVVTDDATTAETDLRVTLKAGDTLAADGCQDFVKVAELSD